ncbi:hypothetical protein JKP88DRAFT_207999 [Tribonema minus]|uniref:Crooked neck protein n=1 Tax=Tribonema minus TaxID=303371 RepID=A0A835ZA95_9STRA|nr:hypothetical protein JKP88DRAFT_207999 [Tribonema minus]
MSRNIQVKNRAPAPIQISAEQILREARDRQIDVEVKAPRQQITDAEELTVFRMRKRKEYEDSIRMQRQHIGTWIKYAAWEESQAEFARARSVYERALAVEYTNQTLWLRYAEMEMKNKFVNHARNVWDRAVALLPRVSQFWFKYSYMEEMVGDVTKARAVFERWMDWEPDDNAWGAYIKFETRNKDTARAREVFKRYVACHPHTRAFLKWARWEERQGQLALARGAYERALSELDEESRTEKLYISFAQFEERCKEYDRARVIYKYALDQMPRDLVPDLYREFAGFEKRRGTPSGIEDAVVGRRRLQYEEEVAADPHAYDTWFDYARLEESTGDGNRVREVYERAVACVPPVAQKRFWRRYVWLWINYALFEELAADDQARARAVLKACLQVVPHESFTFAKIWLMLAHLEVRARDLPAARKVLGNAIGRCPKGKLFKGYIALELQLGEIERCRTLYSRYLAWSPGDCAAWTRFAELERTLGEDERARAVFELAIAQPALDMPEALWKAYIDFEIAGGERARARALYERLLERTQHVKVWASYGAFEAAAEGGGGAAAARAVFERGYAALRQMDLREERVILLEAWRDMEKARSGGDAAALRAVEARMPRRLKKKRMLLGDQGEEVGWEEYYDYRFPDDEQAPANLKILEMAQKWKTGLKRKAADAGVDGDGGDDANGGA